MAVPPEQVTKESVCGYPQKVSPIKVSRNQNRYFNAVLQVGPEEYQDVVCFLADKRATMKSLEDTKSATVLSPVTFTRAKRKTDKEDIQVTKYTKLTPAALHFEYTEQASAGATPINEIKNVNCHQQVRWSYMYI